MVDVALTRPLFGLDPAGALRENRHGALLEGFVAGQLRALAGVARARVRAYHLRQLDGREVDIILERADRRLMAVEVKATSAPHDETPRTCAGCASDGEPESRPP